MKTKFLFCILIGYLLGSLSPAALFSKIKHQNLRQQGTGNLGASNAMLVLGKGYGAFVMLFDIAKAYAASKVAQRLFPEVAYGGLIAGFGAELGHIFPFYLKFKGGKGLAAFGGLALAHDPFLFWSLLILGLILMVIVNYSAAMPMSAGILFPILAGIRSMDITVFLISLAAGAVIVIKHASNVTKGRQGRDIKIREFIKSNLFRNCSR